MNQARRLLKKGKQALPDLSAGRSLSWKTGLVMLGVLSGCLVVVLMHKKVYEVFLQHQQYRVPMNRFHTASLSDWSDQVTRRVLDDIHGSSVSLLDPDGLREMKKRYEASPWVRTVHRIERKGLKKVKVRAELRRPVAVVSDDQGHWYIVDRYGVRLPGTYTAPPVRFGTVYRVNGFTGTPPASGERWSARPVRAAASLAYRLVTSDLRDRLDIAGIEVRGSHRDWEQGRGQLVFRTRRDVRVIWGGSGDQRSPWEPDADQKLKNLRLILRGSPNLRGLDQVKLQFGDPIISLHEQPRR